MSSFHNPSNPFTSQWLSCMETYLSHTHSDLSVEEIRRLPQFKGVLLHLESVAKKTRVSPDLKNGNQVEKYAYLSQHFFDTAMVSLSVIDNEAIYDDYLAAISAVNSDLGIADFSTDDLMGFALCLIMWVALNGASIVDDYMEVIDLLLELYGFDSTEIGQIQDFWEECWSSNVSTSVQYRDASDYSNYKAIPWKMPKDAQIIMLGDWGTGMQDAKELLKSLWKKAYDNHNSRTIVFLHLGDIYYCGLNTECERYFFDVFQEVGQELAQEYGNSNFDPNPPIFTIPGNHEYYTNGMGYFNLLDKLNRNLTCTDGANAIQQCSFFSLRTDDDKWQFIGMDTGQGDHNALLDFLKCVESLGSMVPETVKEIASMVRDELPDFLSDWIDMVEGLAKTTYEDFVGPFAPALIDSEKEWIKDRIDEFDGKTILLSHHQLFSRQAEIDHNAPQYLNTNLMAEFGQYFGNKIAAWYWGHEHSFAIYKDGIEGLNKGRLLGSSAYEATEDSDHPYENNYPMILFDSCMDDIDIGVSSSKLLSHVGSMLVLDGNSITAKYYQFPAWSQLDPVPSNPQLEKIHDETISNSSFKSLSPSWIGNKKVDKGDVESKKGPAIAGLKDKLYLVYNKDEVLHMSVADVSDFRPTSSSDKLSWKDKGIIMEDSNGLQTKHSPSCLAVDGKLYVGFTDKNNRVCMAIYDVDKNKWSAGAAKISGDNFDSVTNFSMCFFQGSIYIYYRVRETKNDISCLKYDVKNDQLSDLGLLRDNTGSQIESEYPPGVAASDDKMMMVYQEKGDSDDLQWALFDPDTGWVAKGDIKTKVEDDKDGEKIHCKHYTCVTCFAEMFVLARVSTNNHNIKNSFYDIEEGSWYGNNEVVIGRNTGDAVNAQSNKGVSMVYYNGGVHLVYKGNKQEDIFWSYY